MMASFDIIVKFFSVFFLREFAEFEGMILVQSWQIEFSG